MSQQLADALRVEQTINTGINLLGNDIVPVHLIECIERGIQTLRKELAQLNPSGVDIGKLNHLLELQKLYRMKLVNCMDAEGCPKEIAAVKRELGLITAEIHVLTELFEINLPLDKQPLDFAVENESFGATS